MAISFVGSHTGLVGSTDTTVNFSSLLNSAGSTPTLQQNDLVIVTVSRRNTANTPIAITTTGYSSVHSSVYANSTDDTVLISYSKFMGATPDSSVVITGAGASNVATYCVHVFRGVDSTTPFDGVTPTTATATGVGSPNAPSITPSSAGAWIVAMGGAAGPNTAGQTTVLTNPANMDTTTNLFRSTAGTRSSTGVAGYSGWTSGAFDPATFGGGSQNASGSVAAATFVLRPAATGISGSGSGSIAFTGSATTTNAVAGSASGTVALTGSGAGAVANSGSGVGTLSMTGSGSGTVEALAVTGSATGAISLTGTGSGSIPVSGAGSGALAFTGGSTVAVAAKGQAGSQFGLGGAASAIVAVTGSASATIAFGGSRNGSVALSGQGSGSISLDGSSAGGSSTSGAASGSLGVGGSGAGFVPVSAVVLGQFDLNGSANAESAVSGSSLGGLAFIGTGTAAVAISGAANDNLGLVGSAAGSATVPVGVPPSRTVSIGPINTTGKVPERLGSYPVSGIRRTVSARGSRWRG